MRRAAAALALFVAACSRAPAPAPEPVEYASPGGRFSGRLPAAWRVDETPGENRLAAFFGPGTGTDAEMIAVSFFPAGSRWKTPLDFALAQGLGARAEPPRSAVVAGARAVDVTAERTVVDEHRGRRVLRVRSLLVPAGGGFFALQDFTDPARLADGADFENFLASFKPGTAEKRN